MSIRKNAPITLSQRTRDGLRIIASWIDEPLVCKGRDLDATHYWVGPAGVFDAISLHESLIRRGSNRNVDAWVSDHLTKER